MPEGRNRALQYRNGQSVVHRLGAWPKLLGAGVLSALALLVEDLRLLGLLLGLVGVGYALAGLSVRALWRDLRWLLLQGVIVVGLTVAFRGSEALSTGGRTALQLLLVFLPMALVVRTTAIEAMIDGLRGWLPERIGFAFGATLRFVPVFARELGELVDMQRLRGAKLSLREAWQPRAWRDWVACVALPMTLRAIEVAEEAADAATIRGIGSTPRAETRSEPT